MVERKTIKVSQDVRWRDVMELIGEGKVDLVISQTARGGRIIEFSENLPEELRQAIEGLDRKARVVSGHNPMFFQIYTMKADSILDLLQEQDFIFEQTTP